CSRRASTKPRRNGILPPSPSPVTGLRCSITWYFQRRRAAPKSCWRCCALPAASTWSRPSSCSHPLSLYLIREGEFVIQHRRSQCRLWVTSVLLGLGAAVSAVQPAVAQKQQGTAKKPKADKPDRAPDDTTPLAKFFESEEPFPITLTLNIKRIRGDKDDT